MVYLWKMDENGWFTSGKVTVCYGKWMKMAHRDGL